MERVRLDKPTQERRVLDVLLEADGDWVSGQYFLHNMLLSQYHRAIWNLENRDGHKIEHSDFTDEYGFKSYRIKKSTAPMILLFD